MTTRKSPATEIATALETYMRTPPGGWPETKQAWLRLCDAMATSAGYRGPSGRSQITAARAFDAWASQYEGPIHPMRRS